MLLQLLMLVQVFGDEVVAVGRQVLNGDSESKELGALQKLGRTAADPLTSLARSIVGLLASGTYSTTALAFTGGIGVFKFGIGAASPLKICYSDKQQRSSVV